MNWDDTLHETEYDEFLHSPEWRALREQVFDRDGRMCVMCKSKNNLRAHHISYEDRLNADYLVTLCDRCHAHVHHYTRCFKDELQNPESEIRKGVDLLNTGITHLIDKFIYARFTEMNPKGDVHFFTGPMAERVNINDYIEKLITLDPYSYPAQKENVGAGGYWISCRGRASWTRYQDIRLKRKKWSEP
jgi:hypothetical protein